MQTPKGILFDLDGTLLDTARDLGNALNYVLQLHEFPQCTYEQYRPIASHGSKGMLELGFGERLNEFDFEQLKEVFLDRYNQNLCVDTCPFDGVEAMITQLDEANLPWGIVTNKPGWLTDALLPNFTFMERCQIVISGDTLAKRKPDPLPLQYAADQMNIEHQAVWYVGDAERDIQAANSANMVSVLAEYGYISQSDRPEQWYADLSIATPLQLVEQVQNA